MDIEWQLDLIEDWLGRTMTQEEEKTAREMLAAPTTPFGGSNSPGYIAITLDIRRKAGGKVA